MRKVSYDPDKFRCKFENDGGITLTRINQNKEVGTYTLRYYGDYEFGEGSLIKAWRK